MNPPNLSLNMTITNLPTLPKKLNSDKRYLPCHHLFDHLICKADALLAQHLSRGLPDISAPIRVHVREVLSISSRAAARKGGPSIRTFSRTDSLAPIPSPRQGSISSHASRRRQSFVFRERRAGIRPPAGPHVNLKLINHLHHVPISPCHPLAYLT